MADLMAAFGDNTGRIRELARKIKEANDAYYNTGKPIMSDARYDALRDELRDLDPKHKLLQTVGAASDESPWEDYEHDIPMSSLDKRNDIDGMIDWVESRYAKKERFCVQDKLDGLSVSIEYLNGKLVRAVTRGDGEKGQDITRNVVQMNGVMSQLKTGFTGFLRGEILMRNDIWERLFRDMANPRNAASGVCRRLDGDGVEHLTVFFYDILPTKGKSFGSEIEKMQHIQNVLQLWTPNYFEADVPGIARIYKDYEDKLRGKLLYEIDGLVIKIDDVERQENLGRSGDKGTGNPKGQVALKFAAEMRETTAKRVTWETGNTGRVTPLAHVEDVRIGGTTVRRASLHNKKFVVKMGISAGARVLVSRRNDVIPQVEEVTQKSDEPIFIPDNCAVCGTKLIEDGDYLQCPNENCAARVTGNIEKWINNLDVDGFGPKLIASLYKKGLVKDVADLYTLKVKDIAGLERIGEKTARKVLDNLHEKKEIPVDTFLGSLNIQGCGRRKFKLLVDAGYDSLEKIMRLKVPQMASVKGMGTGTATAIFNGLRKREKLIARLKKHVKVKSKEKVQGPLTGISFCFTGLRPTKEEQTAAEGKGAEFKSGVSKGLTYLVMSDPNATTGKAKKARDLGTKTISKDEFVAIIEQA